MTMTSLLLAAVLAAEAASPTPAAVDAYVAEVARIEASRTPQSLEPLLAAAEKVQAEVMAIDQEQAWIEHLPEAEYEALKAKLRGLVLSRGFDVYAQPDPDFMLRLADARGRDADRDFFRVYRQHWGAELVPVFLSLTARPTPCVRFGEGVIPGIYDAWRGFVARHPDAYAGFAVQAINDLEEAVALGTCACGDTASVLAEEKGFLERFPDTRVAGQIRSRMQQLRDDPDERPVRCR
ncbi:MAG TPA: hypothetical protein VJM11_21230 [Nevskiaceae bacterium]|nr:hypothetical protein [Nevskiaceae bacterium]